jgi:hypothetical protein
MIIEGILFLAFVLAIGVIVVKLYEWRQDVLYGPYHGRSTEKKSKVGN